MLIQRNGILLKVPVRCEVNILRVLSVKGVATAKGAVVLNQREASHWGETAHSAAVWVGKQAVTVPPQFLGS
jgi:hypothetical protein